MPGVIMDPRRRKALACLLLLDDDEDDDDSEEEGPRKRSRCVSPVLQRRTDQGANEWYVES